MVTLILKLTGSQVRLSAKKHHKYKTATCEANCDLTRQMQNCHTDS